MGILNPVGCDRTVGEETNMALLLPLGAGSLSKLPKKSSRSALGCDVGGAVLDCCEGSDLGASAATVDVGWLDSGSLRYSSRAVTKERGAYT